MSGVVIVVVASIADASTLPNEPVESTSNWPNEPVEVAEPLTSPAAVISNDFDAPPPGLNLNFVPLEPPLNSKPTLSYGLNTHWLLSVASPRILPA